MIMRIRDVGEIAIDCGGALRGFVLGWWRLSDYYSQSGYDGRQRY